MLHIVMCWSCKVNLFLFSNLHVIEATSAYKAYLPCKNFPVPDKLIQPRGGSYSVHILKLKLLFELEISVEIFSSVQI